MARRLQSALVCALLVASPACVVIDAPARVYHDEGGGPPPHAPAHGYRHKHEGRDLVFDRELGVYVVVGLNDVWFLDGSYFRISGEHWEVSVGTPDRWRVASLSVVPVRLQAKRHPHGGPPGQAKKKH
ncbi:MAG TPA: hypothetical protein VFT98_05565 [Myxococcota bacterium]|nr:hypothetical protein [Myxococcota bacterium]